jgi:hypothetical protein
MGLKGAAICNMPCDARDWMSCYWTYLHYPTLHPVIFAVKHVFNYPGLIYINPLLHRRRQHVDKEILDRDRKSAL